MSSACSRVTCSTGTLFQGTFQMPFKISPALSDLCHVWRSFTFTNKLSSLISFVLSHLILSPLLVSSPSPVISGCWRTETPLYRVHGQHPVDWLESLTPLIVSSSKTSSGPLKPYASPCGPDIKISASNTGDPGLIPGSGDPLKKWLATHSSIHAWRIPWTKEPGELLTMGVTKSWTQLSD